MSNLVYTKTSAARILSIPVRKITRMEVWCTVVFVIVKGMRPSFISKKQFKQNFVDFRKQGAIGLNVIVANRASQTVLVSSTNRDINYLVSLNRKNIYCQCEDYVNQAQHLPRACCKHIYAALSTIGETSLLEYLDIA